MLRPQRQTSLRRGLVEKLLENAMIGTGASVLAKD
jgi:hypothetical protein